MEIADGYINSRNETKTQSINLTNQLLKLLLDVKGKKDFDEENFISAKLTLKFKQKEINKEKSLSSIFIKALHIFFQSGGVQPLGASCALSF